MKTSGFLCVAGMLLAVRAKADSVDVPPPSEPAPYARSSPPGRATADLIGGLAGVLALSGTFIDVFPSPPIDGVTGYWHLGTEVAASVPLAVVNPLDGLEVGGLQLAFASGEVGLAAATDKHGIWVSSFEAAGSLSLHQGMFAAYAAYRDLRAGGRSLSWDDAWQPWSGLDLLLAPADFGNLMHPVVAVTLGVELYGAAAFVGIDLASGSHLPKWGAGLRDEGLGLIVSFDAGITEEALFRGFEYEELKLSLGVWPARAIDMTLFTLAHVPGEVGDGATRESIIFGLFTRAVGALLFEFAYDDGGLLESVAFHGFYDAIIFTAGVLLDQPELGNSIEGISAGVRMPSKAQPIFIPVWGGTF